jgi:hypothetical protein
MKLRAACVVVEFFSLLLSLVPLTVAQTTAGTASALPHLVRFGGTVKDLNGNALTGVVGITFTLYSEQSGGAALWIETQNVTADSNGHYVALLGSTTSAGLPAEIFTSEQARWVGVQVSGQAEQARVLLVSAPYALKAGDAETIGGLPPSAFVLAVPPIVGSAAASGAATGAAGSPTPLTTSDVTTTGGTVDYLPIFNGTSTVIDSVLFQTGSGSTAKVGINTTTPASTLDVNGAGTIRGSLSLPAKGTATATADFNSQPITLTASAFNSSTSKAANQTFQWLAQPAGNDTSSPSGTLNLLFAEGSSAATQTGFHIASNGQVTFATGQTFPGTGTVTSVASGLGLTGGPITTSGTLTIDTTVVPQLAANNTFTGNQTVNANVTATNVTATGTVTGTTVTGAVVNATGSFDLGGSVFAFGSAANVNAFLGFAGNSTMTGSNNTASGFEALASNTTGALNAASGAFALWGNTAGSFNTASGYAALHSNTTGVSNTASGADALYYNTTGSNNTAVGAPSGLSGLGGALESNTTGSNNTAVGSGALYNNTTGGNNTASGAGALYSNTTGSPNTATGYYALYSNTTGTYNTAAGAYALQSNTTGTNNTTSGTYTLANNSTGGYDTAMGVSALASNTTGMENTALGAFAAQSNTTGSDLTCIGYNCTVAAPNLRNATAIGARASVSVSDAVVLGSVAGMNGATATTKVGIGTTNPTNLLTLGQGFGPSIADGWTTYSSRRWKTNIQPLHDALGMVEQLRGVSYDLKDSGKREIGVIAEEVGAVVPELVSYEENGKDARGVDYSRLTALLIEAAKEQQALIRKQQAQIARLARQVKTIETTLRANGRRGSEVRTAKAEGTTARQ